MATTHIADWFFDTKAGRIILMVLALVFAFLGVVQIILFFFAKERYLIVMGILSVFCGVCSLIVLNQERKARNRREKYSSIDTEK